MFGTIPRNKIEVYFAETSEGIIGCDKGGSRFQYLSFSIVCVLSNKWLSCFAIFDWIMESFRITNADNTPYNLRLAFMKKRIKHKPECFVILCRETVKLGTRLRD